MLAYEKVIQGHLELKSIFMQLETMLACRLPEEQFMPLQSHEKANPTSVSVGVARTKVTGSYQEQLASFGRHVNT